MNYVPMLEVYSIKGFYPYLRPVDVDSYFHYEVYATVVVGSDNAYDFGHVVIMRVAQNYLIFMPMVVNVRAVRVLEEG